MCDGNSGTTYYRTTFSVNPERHPRLRDIRVATKYCVKAVHTKGAQIQDMVYVSTEDSMIQSLVPHDPPPVWHINRIKVTCSVQFYRRRSFQIFGDVNQPEDETTDVITALCSWKTNPSVAAVLRDKRRCHVCLKTLRRSVPAARTCLVAPKSVRSLNGRSTRMFAV